jgi:hypothetical protein
MDGAAGRLARSQHDRDGAASLGVVDMDRQKAALVAFSIRDNVGCEHRSPPVSGRRRSARPSAPPGPTYPQMLAQDAHHLPGRWTLRSARGDDMVREERHRLCVRPARPAPPMAASVNGIQRLRFRQSATVESVRSGIPLLKPRNRRIDTRASGKPTGGFQGLELLTLSLLERLGKLTPSVARGTPLPGRRMS